VTQQLPFRRWSLNGLLFRFNWTLDGRAPWLPDH
jgi:hypothetical protein